LEDVLFIDSREPPWVAEKIAQLCPIEISVEQLETGDFICGDIAIERKTINDLAASIVDKRLFTQTERMRNNFSYHYVLINGRLQDVEMNINRHAILGAVGKVASLGTRIIWVDLEKDDLVYLILKLFEWHGKLVVPPMKSNKKKKDIPLTDEEVFFEVIDIV
jgi:ERCC4-type nuclease